MSTTLQTTALLKKGKSCRQSRCLDQMNEREIIVCGSQQSAIQLHKEGNGVIWDNIDQTGGCYTREINHLLKNKHCILYYIMSINTSSSGAGTRLLRASG